MHGQYFSLPVSMMSWIQIKMGHPLAQNGAALAPFCANGAHPSILRFVLITPRVHAQQGVM